MLHEKISRVDKEDKYRYRDDCCWIDPWEKQNDVWSPDKGEECRKH